MLFHKLIEKIYKSKLFVRMDDTGLSHYFTHEDFPGLEKEPYSFQSSLGHTLAGQFYSYPGYEKDKLIVFDHGMGCGHLPYMTEIERLCRGGYRVFTYDHTGCMASEGGGIRGFAQSLHDLDDCLKALKRDANVPTDTLFVVGHSWGGFSALNIPALHPDIQKTVVLSGFVSVEKIIEQSLTGFLKWYRKDIIRLEGETNPDYVAYDGVTTLQNAKTRALLLYSDNDPLVHKTPHYDLLQEGLKDCPHVECILLEGKGHNPTYTKEAVAHLTQMVVARGKMKGKKTQEEKAAFRAQFDWKRMAEQDEAVWEHILEFLKEKAPK